jgi:hypothetical protein
VSALNPSALGDAEPLNRVEPVIRIRSVVIAL